MPSFIQIDRHYELQSGFAALRVGTAGKTGNPIDYSSEFTQVRRAEKALLQDITRLPERNIIFMNQVHGCDILAVDSYPEEDGPHAGDIDGMVTSRTGLCLVIRTADCVPVFLFDPRRRVLGAAHSGWRGSRLSIAARLVARMADIYGCHPWLLHAFILPSISVDSYTVNHDVADQFPGDVSEAGGRLHLDLWKNIADGLLGAGLAPENIFNSRICTLRQKDSFFSHRNGDTGRNLNFAFMLS